MRKKDRSPYSFRIEENNLLIIWPTYPQRKPLGSDCARARARANDGRNYAQ